MNELVDSSGVRYAVIKGLYTEAGPERFVIAYPNEQALRDLIAASSIIAIGFTSREEAAVSTSAYVVAAAALKQLSRATVFEAHRHIIQQVGHRRLIRRCRRLGRFLLTFYSEAVTLVTLIFLSRNAVCTAIRTSLGTI